MYEYAKGNYKQALELLGSDFDAIGYKVTQKLDQTYWILFFINCLIVTNRSLGHQMNK